MNFLSEVLSSAGEVQLANLKNEIPKIVMQISKLKIEVTNYMKDSHVEFSTMTKKSNFLLNDANKLNEEMKVLTAQIENLTKRGLEASKFELLNLNADLEESMYALSLVTQLVQISNYLNETQDQIAQKSYSEAIKNICLIKKVFKDIPSDEKLDIIEALHISVAIEYENILYETRKVWKESVFTDKKVLEDGNIILNIKVDTLRSDELKECIKTLCFENPSIFELQCLSNFLMNEIFISVINNNCIVKIENTDSQSILTINVNKTSPKQVYGTVFQNIKTIIEFISFTINFEIKSDVTLLEYIGQKINKQFCEQLINNCIADTVPSTPEGLEKYESVAVEIQELQDFFTTNLFFSKDNEAILDYAKNVDVLFANNACQIYLDTARNILKKDLHDMVEVGEEINLTEEDAPSVLVFSKCYISKNVLEYLELFHKILEQANTSSDMCAGRLIYTADTLIKFYYELVPEYHKKLLETIPQQVALFFNNSMYLSHELLSFKEYKQKLTNPILKNENFLTHLPQIKTVGTEHFLKYIQSQTKQITDILKESDFTKLGQTDQIELNCEKSIRQCLRQLELLKTVWQKVLPCEIYNETIGKLLNGFVILLIKLIIDVEDISSENCNMLVNVFGIVKTRGPKLFTEPKEINLYVNKWYKFNELILLLNSSLSDINDRWADGEGPLAVEFTAEDVKRLIRALFQNTDRRSAVLARIN